MTSNSSRDPTSAASDIKRHLFGGSKSHPYHESGGRRGAAATQDDEEDEVQRRYIVRRGPQRHVDAAGRDDAEDDDDGTQPTPTALGQNGSDQTDRRAGDVALGDEECEEDEEDEDDDDDDTYLDFRGDGVKLVSTNRPNAQPVGQTTLKAQPTALETKAVLDKIRIDRPSGDLATPRGPGGAAAAAPRRPRLGDDVPESMSVDFRALGSVDVGGGRSGGSVKANQRVINQLREATEGHSLQSGQKKSFDRSERATVENVMDPRTRLLLYKLVNGGVLQCVNGCVSTGKEANVYYAVSGDEHAHDLAVKVFKTSILVFKDREKYVSGEFRFQRFCKSNPRKMVRTWAEKEARNLQRLAKGGVRVPQVLLLRQHILIMEFIGHEGWPAPRLKDVRLSDARLAQVYFDLCVLMRKMFIECRLVHGDLSEYNLLYHDDALVLIDVSQSVEHDHPQALTFLRRDIVNVSAFMRTKGYPARMPLSLMLAFVTNHADPQFQDARRFFDDNLGAWEAMQMARTNTDEVDEQVFLQVHVPRRLMDVSDVKATPAELKPYVDAMFSTDSSKKKKVTTDRDDDAVASRRGAIPVADPAKGPTSVASNASSRAAAVSSPIIGDEEDEEEEDDEEDSSEDGTQSSSGTSSSEASEEEEEEADARKRSKKHREPGAAAAQAGGVNTEPQVAKPKTLSEMTKEERKQHKKQVKTEKQETRKEKMPKHLKKKSTKRVKHK